MATALDAGTLFAIFNASFSPDPNVRLAAELRLRTFEPQEGLIPTLLQLISPTSSYDATVRLSAAIYLKNRAATSWRVRLPSTTGGSTPAGYVAIPPSDRQALKTNILPLLAALTTDPASVKVKAQVATVLSKIVDVDYPTDWPGLVDETAVLLTQGEGAVEAGLQASVEILRWFRYNRPDEAATTLPSVITQLFPQLLSLAQRVLASTPTDAASLSKQGSFLHLIIKAYKNSMASSLSPQLQAAESIIPWGTLFLQIVQRPLPVELLPEDLDERERHPWCKARKWALYTLNRLFMRYGNPSQLPSNMKVPYGDFAARFIEQFAPEILRTYLGFIERVVGGEWNSKKTKHHVLIFLEECIRPKATWVLLKPHVQTIVESFVFPLVCLTEDEIEMFEDDPVEFSRMHFGDFIEDSYSNPCATSLTFVTALVETRKSTTLMPLLNLIQTVVSKYPGETTPRQKDGALRMLASLAAVATKTKKLAPMMEAFFQAHVLPEFKSPHGFLRYRACQVVERFESCDMHWGINENLIGMFNAVMDAVADEALPVRIQAAIALPELVRYEDVRSGMCANIGRIMQELLKLADQVDLDALTNTTRALVSEFAAEVVPFAVQLSQQLTTTYTRIVVESVEARKKEMTDGYEGYDEEKTLVCMNILKTLDELVSSLESIPESLDQVEAIIAPVLEYTVRMNHVELYDEVFEILDSLSFLQKKISPAMWPLFEATYHSFKTEAVDYFNEMFGCLDNFITFGAETLAVKGEYRGMILDMFSTVMTSRQMGAEDRVIACKLGEGLLLNLRGQIDEGIPPLIELSMAFVLSPNTDEDFVVTSSLFLHSLELVITALFYNPALSLSILARHAWTSQFFTLWFKNLNKLTRVHDRKLSIGAICGVFEVLASGQNEGLEGVEVMLMAGTLGMFKAFPEALLAKTALEQSFARGGDEDEDDEIEEDEEEIETEDEDDVDDPANDYLEMLANKKQAYADSDDDSDNDSTWSEEILWSSPLDRIDMYQRFVETIASIETSNPTLFAAITTGLDPTQRGELEAVALRARAGGESAVPVPAVV